MLWKPILLAPILLSATTAAPSPPSGNKQVGLSNAVPMQKLLGRAELEAAGQARMTANQGGSVKRNILRSRGEGKRGNVRTVVRRQTQCAAASGNSTASSSTSLATSTPAASEAVQSSDAAQTAQTTQTTEAEITTTLISVAARPRPTTTGITTASTSPSSLSDQTTAVTSLTTPVLIQPSPITTSPTSLSTESTSTAVASLTAPVVIQPSLVSVSTESMSTESSSTAVVSMTAPIVVQPSPVTTSTTSVASSSITTSSGTSSTLAPSPVTTSSTTSSTSSTISTSSTSSTTSTTPSPSPSPTQTLYTTDPAGNGPFSGRATWYDTDVGYGACGTWNTNDKPTVAVADVLFDNWPNYNGWNPNTNPICGLHLNITWGGKWTIAEVADRCPGCPERALDLSRGLFQQFASLDVGVLGMAGYTANMTWSWVAGTGALPALNTS